MQSSPDIVQQFRARLDQALATVIATGDPDDRYFIGEAILGGVAYFILERYAGIYLDEFGAKDAAKRLAEYSKDLLARIRNKTNLSIEGGDDTALFDAWRIIRDRGMSETLDRTVEDALAIELIELGSGRAQAQGTAAEVTAVFRGSMPHEHSR